MSHWSKRMTVSDEYFILVDLFSARYQPEGDISVFLERVSKTV